jgi:hypothetical protein
MGGTKSNACDDDDPIWGHAQSLVGESIQETHLDELSRGLALVIGNGWRFETQFDGPNTAELAEERDEDDFYYSVTDGNEQIAVCLDGSIEVWDKPGEPVD